MLYFRISNFRIFLWVLCYTITLQLNKCASAADSRSWIRRLAFPSGMTLSLTPKFEIPLFTKDSPIGKVEISVPLSIDFDQLGWPATLLYPNPGLQLMPRRGKRDINRTNSSETMADAYSVGERASFFWWIIQNIHKLGLDGKGCLLRATCEIHQDSLNDYGLLGEMITLLFTFSTSNLPASKDFKEILHAERLGRRGNCRPYYNQCKLSIFRWHSF